MAARPGAIGGYDFRNSPVPEGQVNYDFNGGGMQDVYYTSSSDNGETFARRTSGSPTG